MTNLISKFENYYGSAHTYIPLQSQKLNFTEDEERIIDNHPEIFFQASRSRILLMVWLCDILRKTFERYDYSDLEMQNETYEILRNHFKTKAFNRKCYIESFECEKTNLLTYEHFVDLERRYIEEYNKYSEKKRTLKPHIGIRPNSVEIEFNKELEKILDESRSTDIIYQHSQGKTLDEIGNSLGITRERTRQIEFKPRNDIQRWLFTREDEIYKKLVKNNVVNQDKAIKLFGEKNWQIVKYVISINNNNNSIKWKYYSPLDIVYYSTDLIDETLKESLEKLMSDSAKRNALEVFTNEISKKYPFWTKEYSEHFLNEHNYSIYNYGIFEGKVTITKAITEIVKEYYPQGINISNKKEFNDFITLINTNFNLKVSEGRALIARMQDVLVKQDKNTFVLPNAIDIPQDLLLEIENYINTMSEEKIAYNILFKEFEEKLRKKSNISNKYYLHTALKYLQSQGKININCYRYYVGKHESEKEKSKEYFKKFYDFLMEQKEPVRIEDILKEFPLWDKIYLRYATIYFPSIVQWSQDEYFCLDSLSIAENDKKEIISNIEKALDNKYGYTSSYVIFDMLNKEKAEMLKKYFIYNNNQMFHMINYLVGDKYFCRKPHVLKSYTKNTFSARDLIKLIIGNDKIINKKEIFKKAIALYGNKNSSLTLALQEELKDYIKIDSKRFTKKENLKISQKTRDEISNLIKERMIKGEVLLPNKIEDFEVFPEVKFDWTPWLLCEIVKNYNFDFKVIGSRNLPAQSTMSIVLKTNSVLTNRNEVFNWLLKNDYTGTEDIHEIFKYAKETGIFYTNLTQKDIQEIIEK